MLGDGGGRAANNGGMGGDAGGNGGSGRSGGDGGGSNLGNEIGTVGPGEGYGSGHSQGLGTEGGVSTEAISSAREAVGYGQSAKDAASAFGGWQTSVDTQMGPKNTAYKANAPRHNYSGTFGENLDANPISMRESTLRAQQNIQESAKPGLIGRALSWGSTLLGQPLASTAIDVGFKGYNAAQRAEAHNAKFGTDVDTGLFSNMGQQAAGSIASIAGGMVGGRLGAKLGASVAGIDGAMAGGTLGSLGLGSAARSAVMSGGEAQGAGGPPVQSRGGNDRDNADITDANSIASAREDSDRKKAIKHPTGKVNTSKMYGYKPNYTFDSLSGDALKSFYS